MAERRKRSPFLLDPLRGQTAICTPRRVALFLEELDTNLDYVVQDEILAIEASILHLLEAERTFIFLAQQSLKINKQKGTFAKIECPSWKDSLGHSTTVRGRSHRANARTGGLCVGIRIRHGICCSCCLGFVLGCNGE